MSIALRAARALARVFPRHVAVLAHDSDAYPLASEVRVAFRLAQQDAIAYGQLQPTPERLLLAALENDPLVQALERAGGRVEPMREELLFALASPAVAAEARALPRSPRLARVLAHALERSRRLSRAELTFGDVLAGLASTEGLPWRLRGGLALDYAAFDTPMREPLAAPADPGASRVSLWILNDDVSKMEDVMRILEQGLSMPVRRACHLMMSTDAHGHARIGTYPRAEAEAHRARAQRHADARSSPLQFHLGTA